jgi:hypothetical protein
MFARFSTRINSNTILIQKFNTAVRKNSYSVKIAKYWNKLPDNITKLHLQLMLSKTD